VFLAQGKRDVVKDAESCQPNDKPDGKPQRKMIFLFPRCHHFYFFKVFLPFCRRDYPPSTHRAVASGHSISWQNLLRQSGTGLVLHELYRHTNVMKHISDYHQSRASSYTCLKWRAHFREGRACVKSRLIKAMCSFDPVRGRSSRPNSRTIGGVTLDFLTSFRIIVP